MSASHRPYVHGCICFLLLWNGHWNELTWPPYLPDNRWASHGNCYTDTHVTHTHTHQLPLITKQARPLSMSKINHCHRHDHAFQLIARQAIERSTASSSTGPPTPGSITKHIVHEHLIIISFAPTPPCNWPMATQICDIGMPISAHCAICPVTFVAIWQCAMICHVSIYGWALSCDIGQLFVSLARPVIYGLIVYTVYLALVSFA